MTASALILIALAVGLIRLGWNGPRGAAAIGWALAVAGLAMLAARDGAWGLAIGSVTGMAAALALVLRAGWTSPVKMRRAAREPISVSLPRRPADLGRRLLVFVLVVPVAFAAAQWLAYGAQSLARRQGAGETDAIVLTLFLQPLLWAGLMAWQMTRAGPLRMIVAPAGAAILGTLFWSLA